MGMFNTIIAGVLCPATNQINAHSEIQIKWQAREARLLDVYYLGDSMPDLLPEYDNTWIRTDYICNACSPKSHPRNGRPYIRTENQHRHVVFVEVEDGKVCRVLTELEFAGLGIDKFCDYM